MTRVILFISLALNAVALVAALYVRQLATDFVVGQASRQAVQMRSQFEVLRPPASPVVFLGDSITNRGMWSELLGNPRVVNRGIGGTGDRHGLRFHQPCLRIPFRGNRLRHLQRWQGQRCL